MKSHASIDLTERPRFVSWRILVAALSLTAGPLQAAPATPPLESLEIRTQGIGGDFALIDQHGHPTRLSDFAGDVVVLVFGYTSCPDVCPTTLSKLARLTASLDDAGRDVQVLFTSVDPARDTPERLGSYVQHFDTDFRALTGSAEEIADVARQYDVRYSVRSGAGDEYAVEHSVYGFLIDTRGRARYSFPFDIDPDLLSEGVRRLLGEDDHREQQYCEQRLSMADDFGAIDESNWACSSLKGRWTLPLGASSTMCR